MTRSIALLAAGISVLAFTSATYAADLVVEEPAAPVVAPAAGDWDGFYLGLFTGYGVGTATDDADEVTDDEIDLDGSWIGGITAGADFTLTEGVILGVVGDLEYLGLDGISDDDIAYDLYWGGSLRGKLGFDGGSFLPYLTAGVAFGSAKAEGSGAITGSDTNTHVGWTAGAGVEFALADDLSLDLLYRYTDYGTATYEFDNEDHEIGFTTHQLTIGANWRF